MIYDPRPDLLYLKERQDKLETAVKSILAVLEKITNYNKEIKDEHSSTDERTFRK